MASIADADRSFVKSGSKIASTIVVDKSGHGNFNSIQSAIDSIPPNNRQWIKLQINPAYYLACFLVLKNKNREKVTIPREKPFIVLEGQHRSVTTITFDAHDKTDSSSTFTSNADNIVAKRITFMNSFNHALLPRRLSSDDSIPQVKQAVAARILGDKCAFFECGFLGLQDTLWDARGRHYFQKCYIEGAIDFIWGDGQSFYEDCSIVVTAGAFSPQIRQGRAYRAYSRVIFQETIMDVKVVPEGWFAWSFVGKEENFTYAEVNCKGQGSDTSKRVPWEKKLNSAQLKEFSKSSFVDQDGWIVKLP
ncbi:hypothetical protein REPUB_Repub12eG0205300 [Reevesia pubescens]